MHPAVSRKSNWAPKSEILGVGDEFPCRECPLLYSPHPLLNSHHHASVCEQGEFYGGAPFEPPPKPHTHKRPRHLQQKQLRTVPDFGSSACVRILTEICGALNQSTNNKAFLGKISLIWNVSNTLERAPRANNGPVRRQVFLKHLRQFFSPCFCHKF